VLSPEDELRTVTELTKRLTGTYPDVASDRIENVVHQSHERFAGRPIRDFVPVLVDRHAQLAFVG